MCSSDLHDIIARLQFDFMPFTRTIRYHNPAHCCSAAGQIIEFRQRLFAEGREIYHKANSGKDRYSTKSPEGGSGSTGHGVTGRTVVVAFLAQIVGFFQQGGEAAFRGADIRTRPAERIVTRLS